MRSINHMESVPFVMVSPLRILMAVSPFPVGEEDFLRGGSPSQTSHHCAHRVSSVFLPDLVVIAAVLGIVIYRVVTVSTFAAFKWALIKE